MKLSVIIPAHNEASGLQETVVALTSVLNAAAVPHEILIVNDHSSDSTANVLTRLANKFSTIRWVDNEQPGGYGYAVRTGLEQFRGDAVCIVMADASDDPHDVVRYYRLLEDGYDCAFGSRFMSQSRVVDYPRHKLLINRLANTFIRLLFGLPYNDVTNAFKCYRRDVIDGIQPILACHFNLTVELPLKAITRGYTYGVVPINWYNRTTGISKLKIKEMGSRYLFIVLYVLLEKLLSQGDYRRPDSRRTVVAREQTMQRSGDG
jgi:dolichol-phosphate mannosyltransferase